MTTPIARALMQIPSFIAVCAFVFTVASCTGFFHG